RRPRGGGPGAARRGEHRHRRADPGGDRAAAGLGAVHREQPDDEPVLAVRRVIRSAPCPGCGEQEREGLTAIAFSTIEAALAGRGSWRASVGIDAELFQRCTSLHYPPGRHVGGPLPSTSPI